MIGIIGGTCLKDVSEFKGRGEVYFRNRHGNSQPAISYGMPMPHQLPHQIDYKAIINDMENRGVEKIIAVFTVGALSDYPVGSIVIPDSFLDFTKNRDGTYGMGHSQVQLLKPDKDIGAIVGGTYVCVEGPRFSTKAESKMYKMLGGDIIGMTMVPECVLAAEKGIPYLPICLVTDTNENVTYDEIKRVMALNEEKIKSVIRQLL